MPGRGRRRRGSRRGVALAAVVVVLLGAGTGGGFLWKAARDRNSADRAVRDVALAYLGSWRAIDRDGPAPLPTVTPSRAAGGTDAAHPSPSPSAPAVPKASTAPASFVAAGSTAGTGGAGQAGVAAVTVPGAVDVPTLVAAMTDMRDRLRVDDATFDAGKVHRSGSAATIPYTATLRLEDEPTPWTYPGQLSLAKVGSVWRVRARLDSVQPDLAPGLRFDRTGSTASRGRLLDASGRPLTEDSELTGNLVGQVSPPSGLQRAYNDRLEARGGQIVLRDAAGKTVKTPQTWPMAKGETIRTSIDLSVQQAAEAALATSSWPTGALVAIDTRTGGILASANHPLNGYGRALRGTYPPGSTFKIVTATAALMSGRNANTQLDCSQTITAGGRSFSNAENEQFGPLTLREAFARSCNTAFIGLAESLPPGALAKAAQLYGFDGTPPLPIASVGGVFPAPRDGAETASAAIGQGRIAASPAQMASVAAAVASGTWRSPFVVGGPARSHQLPAKILPDLRSFMRAVVTDGTAAQVPFPGEVFGKTGTAEYNAGNPPPTDAWFVGYRGPIAFAVLVEDGGFGATSAAPIAAAFLNALDGNLAPPADAAAAATAAAPTAAPGTPGAAPG
jgi:hypothetical protein